MNKGGSAPALHPKLCMRVRGAWLAAQQPSAAMDRHPRAGLGSCPRPRGAGRGAGRARRRLAAPDACSGRTVAGRGRNLVARLSVPSRSARRRPGHGGGGRGAGGVCEFGGSGAGAGGSGGRRGPALPGEGCVAAPRRAGPGREPRGSPGPGASWARAARLFPARCAASAASAANPRAASPGPGTRDSPAPARPQDLHQGDPRAVPQMQSLGLFDLGNFYSLRYILYIYSI